VTCQRQIGNIDRRTINGLARSSFRGGLPAGTLIPGWVDFYLPRNGLPLWGDGLFAGPIPAPTIMGQPPMDYFDVRGLLTCFTLAVVMGAVLYFFLTVG